MSSARGGDWLQRRAGNSLSHSRLAGDGAAMAGAARSVLGGRARLSVGCAR